jgi:hypothetical protein
VILCLFLVVIHNTQAQTGWPDLLENPLIAIHAAREADGALTIAAVDENNSLHVLSDESGVWEMLWEIELPARVRRHGVRVVDVNGDGVNEILAVPGQLHMFSRDGALRWVAEETFELHFAAVGFQRIDSADVDGDGSVEVLLLNYVSPETPSTEVSLYLYDSDDGENWRVVYRVLLTDDYEFHSTAGITAADFDGNGTAEIVVGNDNGFMWLVTLEDGVYGVRAHWEVFSGSPIGTGLASGDLDGDGLPELLVGTNGGSIFVYDFSTDLEPILAASTFSGRFANGISAGDVDGDGVDEFVLGRGLLEFAEMTAEDVVVEIYELVGDMLWRRWSTEPGEMGDTPFTLAFDFDADGSAEIITLDADGAARVLQPELSALHEPCLALVTTDAARVNVRSGPGTGYAVVTSAAVGTLVPVLELGDGWYRVLIENEEGWISAQLLTLEGEFCESLTNG